MDFREEIGRVAASHIDEIRGDLDRARHELSRARGDVSELERQIASMENLLELAGESGGVAVAEAPSTLHEAMRAVLADAPGQMMRAGDIAAAITRRGLYRMRDGRAVEPQQIHARVGHYDHLFAKEGTFIKLIA